MTTTNDKPRSTWGGARANSGGARPGSGRPRKGDVTVCVRLPHHVRDFWRDGGTLSDNVRSLLTDVADGDAVVMGIDTADHLAVAPWLAARLAEVEAQDRDDTTLEDWLRGLLNALAEASQQRCTEDNARRDPW